MKGHTMELKPIHTQSEYKAALKAAEALWDAPAKSTEADRLEVLVKKQAFALYGYTGYDDPRCVPAGKRRCEIDHLVSRELGGADEVINLWPQAYGTSPWNAVLKDKLENRLHKEMCAGNITLKAARVMLVNDWREAYKSYYGDP